MLVASFSGIGYAPLTILTLLIGWLFLVSVPV